MTKKQASKVAPPRIRLRRPRVRRQKLRFIDPVLVSAPEFARLSGLGYSSVRQLIADGVLPVLEINGRKWILREEAVAWLRQQVARVEVVRLCGLCEFRLRENCGRRMIVYATRGRSQPPCYGSSGLPVRGRCDRIPRKFKVLGTCGRLADEC
jgi:hypothetical protein